MRNTLALATLAALAAIAVPAHAEEEIRVEARGGVFFQGGSEEATLGGAIGIDGDIASGVFAGFEVSGDKILQGGTDVAWGASARLGFNATEATKVYATGGWVSAPCDVFCSSSWSLGGGAQHALGERLYAKAEYRHFFAEGGFADGDAVLVGIGARF